MLQLVNLYICLVFQVVRLFIDFDKQKLCLLIWFGMLNYLTRRYFAISVSLFLDKFML